MTVQAHGAATKIGRGASDDGQLMPIQPDFFAQYIAVAMKAVLPHPVADDGHRKRAGLFRSFFRKKSATENGLHIQHIKVVRGHKFRPGTVSIAFQSESERRKSRDRYI